MSEDFKARLIAHAKAAVERAARAHSEAATQQYLVLPFFQLLGYDPLNPDEVVPEAHASFSEKFKNRVDYAICQDHEPVIAVECKKAGTLDHAQRGELKGYFNAVSTVKLGILTDGLAFELFSDTGQQNMMDDEPFATIDLSEVADGRITDNALDALLKLQKGTFDPADVGADAKRKIFIASYVQALEASFKDPAESLVKTLMDLAGVEGRRTARLLEEHTPIVREALLLFLDKKILERVGFAERHDLVRVESAPAAAQPATVAAATTEEVREAPAGDDGVVTTETEIEVYDYVRRRLAYLSEDEETFQKLAHLFPRDYKTVFSVCYKQERKGKLFNFTEGASPKFRFEFPELNESVATDNLSDIDEPLLNIFRIRVRDLG